MTHPTVRTIAGRAAIALIAGLAMFVSNAAMATSQLLAPSWLVFLPGTTAMQEPDLVGPSNTIKQKFKISNSAGALVCAGWLEQMIVHSSTTHFFHFYYRILKTSGPGAISSLMPAGFGRLQLFVAYRHDLAPGVQPTSAFRDISGNEVFFQLSPPLDCSAHQATDWLLIKPNADQVYWPALTRIGATSGNLTDVKTYRAVH
jgi:hypothetical protein